MPIKLLMENKSSDDKIHHYHPKQGNLPDQTVILITPSAYSFPSSLSLQQHEAQPPPLTGLRVVC